MSTKFDLEVILDELINIGYSLTEYVSAQGREGRGFESDCEQKFFFLKMI
jgi:hypothetical protein